jgi:hypothetical protein
MKYIENFYNKCGGIGGSGAKEDQDNEDYVLC